MKRKVILIALPAAGILVGAFLWFKLHGNTQAGAEGAENAKNETSALVKTQPVARQDMDSTLLVYGDVATGKPSALGFPQAGQIFQILVVVGQRVHRGDVLASLTSDPVSQAAYSQAQSAAKLADKELHRNEELFALQLATQSQVDAARKQLQDADSNLAAQKKLGGDAATASLLAPFDGVVTALAAGQGDRVAAGTTVLQLGRADSFRIQLGVEPSKSRLIKAGMPVAIATLEDPTTVIAGKLSEIQSLVDPKTQLVGAMVELPAKDASALVPGMHIQGTIQLGKYSVWSVPRQAVLSDDKGGYVFQIAGGKARRVAVTRLIENAGSFGVEGKLDPALPVVVSGNYELQDGMAVREAAR